MRTDAIFSNDRIYRYRLSRYWDDTKPAVLFIGLNPSTADEKTNDPTIRRLIGFARRWGFGTMHVCNLYAFRTPYPKELFKYHTPVGPENDAWIKRTQEAVEKVVLVYGTHGTKNDRHLEILDLVNHPWCVKYSKYNLPMHPLYLSYTKQPLAYEFKN
ncbi:MAG: DUF1643 domain-containing protein [Bacteroidota bacterium]